MKISTSFFVPACSVIIFAAFSVNVNLTNTLKQKKWRMKNISWRFFVFKKRGGLAGGLTKNNRKYRWMSRQRIWKLLKLFMEVLNYQRAWPLIFKSKITFQMLTQKLKYQTRWEWNCCSWLTLISKIYYYNWL